MESVRLTAYRNSTLVEQFTIEGVDENGDEWDSELFEEITFVLRRTPPPDTVVNDSAALIKITMSGDILVPDECGSITFPNDVKEGVLRIEASAIDELPTQRRLFWDIKGRVVDAGYEERITVLASGTLEVYKSMVLQP